jgi:predicted GIY-YIG superfamily endonuclease
MTERASLYRHWDTEGRLLYVGISTDVINRLQGHRSCSLWYEQIHVVEVEHFATRQEALAAETAAIKAEKPLFNVINNRPPKPPRPPKVPARNVAPRAVLGSTTTNTPTLGGALGDAYLSCKQTAGILNISTACLERLDDKGKGPPRLKFAPRIHRYSARGVLKWLRIINEKPELLEEVR